LAERHESSAVWGGSFDLFLISIRCHGFGRNNAMDHGDDESAVAILDPEASWPIQKHRLLTDPAFQSNDRFPLPTNAGISVSVISRVSSTHVGRLRHTCLSI